VTNVIHTHTCVRCGEEYKRLETSRPSRYCGRPCQKAATNARSNARRAPTGNPRGRPTGRKAPIQRETPSDLIHPSKSRANGLRYAAFGLRAVPRFTGETIEWTACNDVTRKATIAGKNANASALAYAIKIESPSLRLDRSIAAHDDGWWGRVGNEFSFGPCATPERAQTATEAFLRREPMPQPRGNERYRKGNVWNLIGGVAA
jgi:hypothetical protein